MPRRLRRRLSVELSDQRDLILFKKHKNWLSEDNTSYNRKDYFDYVTKEDMHSLLAHGFKVKVQDPEFMPSIPDMFMFMGKYSHYYFHGYVIGPYCSDTRVSIEGIELHCDTAPTAQEREYFRLLFREASELTIDGTSVKAWYD